MEKKFLLLINLIFVINALNAQNLTLGIEDKDFKHILLYDNQEVVDTIYHHPFCKLSLISHRVISEHEVAVLIESCQIGYLLSYQRLEKRENSWMTIFEKSIQGDQQWSTPPRNYKTKRLVKIACIIKLSAQNRKKLTIGKLHMIFELTLKFCYTNFLA